MSGRGSLFSPHPGAPEEHGLLEALGSQQEIGIE